MRILGRTGRFHVTLNEVGMGLWKVEKKFVFPEVFQHRAFFSLLSHVGSVLQKHTAKVNRCKSEF